MVKNYFISQLTQTSAWLGAGVVVAAFILPRTFILILGLLLIVSSDKWLQSVFARWSPHVRKALEGDRV